MLNENFIKKKLGSNKSNVVEENMEKEQEKE